MTRYLALLSFTDEGLRKIWDSVKRASDFRAAVEKAGGRVLAQYWAVGEVDGCVVFEVPDDQRAANVLLALGQKGNVRTRSLRIFDAAEFAQIAPASTAAIP